MDNAKAKVGIMTWHAYRNYGSALQASALYHKIELLGYDPALISYQPKGDAVVRSHVSWFDLMARPVKAVERRRNRHYVSPEREALFAQYMAQRVTETQPCNTYPELFALNEQMDAFVCGSDQIWAPSCFDDKYFLSFVDNDQKKVAYAPSIGLAQVKEPAVRREMEKWISRFVHLSVREQQGAETIRALTGKEALVVADPTLLLERGQWDDFAGVERTARIDGDYIVCYFLGEAEKYMAYVNALSRKTGMKAYLIPVTKKQTKSDQAVPFEVGPAEFVSLVRNAKYVCTDSFHGMVFSINYGVPFFVFKRFADYDPKNQNSRIISLLNIAGLSERLVDPKGAVEEKLLTCDFSACEKAVQALRSHSAAYLEVALKQATGAGPEAENRPWCIADLCCGCGACAAVCPRGAITISRDAEGFQHYAVDEEKCIRCGACRKVCPFRSVTAPSVRTAQKLYAVKSTSEQTLKTSSSGGVGHELARCANEKGAWVCGCVYDTQTNSARHILIAPDQKEQLPRLQGSKYIQSITSDALGQIAGLAKEEKLYFFGTPCQCAAVSRLLEKQGRRDDGVLVDLICHGVPSYHLWEKYLSDLDRTDQTGKNPSVQFRQKKLGWRDRWIEISGQGHVFQKAEAEDDFYAFFRRGLCDMPTCYDCPYRERSAADIRMGDYWGPRFVEDRQGVSMVIANTLRGVQAVESLCAEGLCTAREYPLEEYWSVQYPYNHPKPVFRGELIEELKAGTKTLSSMRGDFCQSYDMNEKYSKMKQKIKGILGRSKVK